MRSHYTTLAAVHLPPDATPRLHSSLSSRTLAERQAQLCYGERPSTKRLRSAGIP